MNNLTKLKAGIGLVFLVLISGAIGALLAHRFERLAREKQANPETWNEAAMRNFERVVEPTPEQGTIIKERLDKALEELKLIRSETITRSTNVIWRLVEDVEKELTPQQRKAFETMKPSHGELNSLDVLQVKPKQK